MVLDSISRSCYQGQPETAFTLQRAAMTHDQEEECAHWDAIVLDHLSRGRPLFKDSQLVSDHGVAAGGL